MDLPIPFVDPIEAVVLKVPWFIFLLFYVGPTKL